MNAINRIGQKVICVAENAIWQYLCETIRTHPIKGNIYTVTGFAPIMGELCSNRYKICKLALSLRCVGASKPSSAPLSYE